MKRIIRGLLILSLIFAVYGGSRCAQKKESGDTPQPEAVFDTSVVSLSGQIMPIFERSCGGCHRRENGNRRAVSENDYFETKADIMARVGTGIIPGQPDNSGFLAILNQSAGVGDEHMVMPPPGSPAPKWNDAELTLFRQWIEQGAEDN